MITYSESIQINALDYSRVVKYNINEVPFGKVFTDHMFIADYKEGHWQNLRIVPYQKFEMSYAMSALHYGQAIFEGMKAFRQDNGDVVVFRMRDNWARLNRSAVRMAMPEVPEEIFVEGLLQLLKLDKVWVPDSENGSLYIRPFMIATEEAIGVKISSEYQFIIIASPAGVYYSKPIKALIQNTFYRSVKGGIGYVKAAGNYGRSLYPTKLAQDRGYQQILWLDAEKGRYIEEAGTMNVMFVKNGTLITPELTDTLLSGITRDSVLKLARKMGIPTEERRVSVEEILTGIEKGEVTEAFGVGTAATVAHITTIGREEGDLIRDYVLPPVEERKYSHLFDKTLRDIRKGRIPDEFGWLIKVER
ncbi:MAG: putative branched-chain-amino-acid aminotransferase [Bacteroidia bacterium]|nr:MAG: putative branched-chain-amino-acid aminotransferase [Bacteroidia bacterium]